MGILQIVLIGIGILIGIAILYHVLKAIAFIVKRIFLVIGNILYLLIFSLVCLLVGAGGAYCAYAFLHLGTTLSLAGGVLLYLIFLYIQCKGSGNREAEARITAFLQEIGIIPVSDLNRINPANFIQTSSASAIFVTALKRSFCRENAVQHVVDKLSAAGILTKGALAGKEYFYKPDYVHNLQQHVQNEVEKIFNTAFDSQLVIPIYDVASNVDKFASKYEENERDYVNALCKDASIHYIENLDEASYSTFTIKEKRYFVNKRKQEDFQKVLLSKPLFLAADIEKTLGLNGTEAIQVFQKMYPDLPMQYEEDTEGNKFWLANGEIPKHVCEHCGNVFLNLTQYGHESLCKDCLEKQKNVEESGETVETAIDESEVPDWAKEVALDQ